MRASHSNRQQEILGFLENRDSARVEELSSILSVSSATVRRDLDIMNDMGLVIRTHGGARSNRHGLKSGCERSFFEKGITNSAEKRRIASFAATLIEDNETIFLNSGTTTLFFLEELHVPARIVSNNAASILSRKNPDVDLILVGGEYRDQSKSFVGDFALDNIRNVNADACVLGANSMSISRGITTSVLGEMGINKMMIANTMKRVILLVDHSKFESLSSFQFTSMEEIDVLVTDDRTPQQIIRELEKKNIEVFVV